MSLSLISIQHAFPLAPEQQQQPYKVNKNIPGMLSKITDCFAAESLNIVQQINQSRGIIAYNVLDIDTSNHPDVVCFKKVQERITMLEGVLSSRLLLGIPGQGYAKNLDGEYFV